jgi:hypothetical protein
VELINGAKLRLHRLLFHRLGASMVAYFRQAALHPTPNMGENRAGYQFKALDFLYFRGFFTRPTVVIEIAAQAAFDPRVF